MRRSESVDIPGGTFHVMNRGNRKARIFEDDCDREMFKRILTEVTAEYGVDVLCEAQLVTHFHAVVTTPHGNLSDFMERWEGRYAHYYNARHRRVGHLFQGPYRCVIVEHDLHLFIAAAYVFYNPVKSGLVAKPQDWKWSTYAANAGLVRAPSYLSTAWIETLFPTSSLHQSQAVLRQCIDDGQPIRAYFNAVDSNCEESLRSYIAERLNGLEQPCSYAALTRPPLEHLVPKAVDRSHYGEVIRVAHETYGYRLKEIAPYLGLQPANVSRLYRSHRRAIDAVESSASREIQLTADLLDFDRPTDADLELRHEAATTDAEFSEKTVVMLKAKEITAAGMHLTWRVFEAADPRDGDDRPAALNERPLASAKLELGDQINIDRPKPQTVTEPAVDARADSKPPADVP